VSTIESLPTEGPVDISPGAQDKVVKVKRRTVDAVLIALGAVVTVVLFVAGGLLTWGSRFANDYVSDELTAQNIFLPDRAALEEEGRTDLLGYAGAQVTSGSEAQAYASYIGHHLEGIADEAAVVPLQEKADEITNQRNSLFKGETLRGLLLSTYAWSTIGRIAGIAAIAAFVAGIAMLVLVILGVVHRQRLTT
jgi:hypothetical protein